MMNIISYEPVAREIRRDREAEAEKWALRDQLPRTSHSDATAHHGLIAALMSLLSAVSIFHR